MEIPVINRISDFEAGISYLKYPSFISQVYVLSGIEKIYETHSFLKWGALILALLASLSTIINKLKILIIKRHHSLPSQTLLYDTDFDTDIDSSSDDEPEYEEPSTSQNHREVVEDFRVRGSGSGHLVGNEWQNSNFTIRKRRSSEELTSGKSLVKLWDNLTLGFGFDVDQSDDVLNLYDVNKGTNVASIFGEKGRFQSISAPFSSPAVVITAGVDSSSQRVAIGAWDTRLSCRVPAIVAEWRPKQSMEKIAAVNVEGVEKVYIRGDLRGKLTVGDMRMVISPLGT